MQVKMTFHVLLDNKPEHRDLAHPPSSDPRTLHEKLGGTGTFEDPITTAARTVANGGIFSPGTRLYMPSREEPSRGKYLLIEDECPCERDQLNVWMESPGNCKGDQLQRVEECARTWTQMAIEVEIEPASNHPVDERPFFDTKMCLCTR